MKHIYKYLFLSLFVLTPSFTWGQTQPNERYKPMVSRINVLDTAGMDQKINDLVSTSYELADTTNALMYKMIYVDLLVVGHKQNAALDYASKLILDSKSYGNDSVIGMSYYHSGKMFYELEDLVTASSMFNQSIQYFLKADKWDWICIADDYIGILNLSANRYEAAIESYLNYIKLVNENNYQWKISGTYNNIGLCYTGLNRFEIAMAYFDTSLQTYTQEKNQVGIGRIYNNMGSVYLKMQKYPKALEYFQKGYSIRKESAAGEPAIIESMVNIGTAQYELGFSDLAIENLENGVRYGKSIGSKELQIRAYSVLKELYYKRGNYKKSFDLQKEYYLMKDTLYGQRMNDELITSSLSSKFKRKIMEDSIAQSQKDLFHKEELRSQHKIKEQIIANNKLVRNFLLLGIGMTVLILIVLFKRFKEKKQANAIIYQQKEELQQKQTEVLDSIVYAKRIQSAILPPEKLIKTHFPDSFILYKPKDIVAGDFYWLEPKEDVLYFAVADCTGHGVPGAMISVMCNNGLNRAVREHGLTTPGGILDQTREFVISEFSKSEDKVMDGMDIALCALNGRRLSYSGANNPLWMIRKGGTEVFEIKADCQPIGKFGEGSPFTTHEIEVDHGDTLYIFSDGFSDQFGGAKGKKFKLSNFKKLLLSIQNEGMQEQKRQLEQAFETWKGDLEQIDDVCVMGVSF